MKSGNKKLVFEIIFVAFETKKTFNYFKMAYRTASLIETLNKRNRVTIYSYYFTKWRQQDNLQQLGIIICNNNCVTRDGWISFSKEV